MVIRQTHELVWHADYRQHFSPLVAPTFWFSHAKLLWKNMTCRRQQSCTQPSNFLFKFSYELTTADRHAVKSLQMVLLRLVKWLNINHVNKSQTKATRSSAVAKRPRDVSCHWIFCEITQDHSRSFEMTLLSRACVSPY